jgi:hypothetical protein
MTYTSLHLGDLQDAQVHARTALSKAEEVGEWYHIGDAHRLVGVVLACRGLWERAVGAFENVISLAQEAGLRSLEVTGIAALGRVHLAQENQRDSIKLFKEAVVTAGSVIHHSGRWGVEMFAQTLSGLEEAHAAPEVFRSFCRLLHKDHPEIGDSGFEQWYLEPANARVVQVPSLQHDEFADALSSDWAWQDPFGDCAYGVQNGLSIHAANGRDLWELNLGAPRVLRLAPEQMDWAVQTVCVPVSDAKPTIGGLLLWKDEENYLRLDRGRWGEYEISYGGCLANEDMIFGRGRLATGDSGRVFLRLERVGDLVKALCSADGEEWFKAGEVEFAAAGVLQIGLHAIGWIDRAIYHGAYLDGTAIRFESYRLWGLDH